MRPQITPHRNGAKARLNFLLFPLLFFCLPSNLHGETPPLSPLAERVLLGDAMTCETALVITGDFEQSFDRSTFPANNGAVINSNGLITSWTQGQPSQVHGAYNAVWIKYVGEGVPFFARAWSRDGEIAVFSSSDGSCDASALTYVGGADDAGSRNNFATVGIPGALGVIYYIVADDQGPNQTSNLSFLFEELNNELDVPRVTVPCTANAVFSIRNASIRRQLDLRVFNVQWQEATDPAGPFSNIDGATDNTYTIANPPISLDGTYYRARYEMSANGQVFAETQFSPVALLRIIDPTMLPEIDVNDDVASTDVGFVPMNSSGTLDLEISNPGLGPLQYSEIESDNPLFTVTPNSNTTGIPVNGTQTITVTFSPLEQTDETATLRIYNDDCDENPYTFMVTGSSVPVVPEISISGNGMEIMSGDNTPSTDDDTDFGSRAVGETFNQTFTITNSGTGPLTLSGAPLVTISGDAVFSISTQPTSPVANNNGTTDFVVTLSSSSGTSIGEKTATITVASDDDDEGSYTFDVKTTLATAVAYDETTNSFFATVQSAFDALPDNAATPNIVYIFPGSYTEDLSTENKNVIVRFGLPPAPPPAED